MGSFRRQLIALLLTTTPAYAEVCSVLRPGWSPADGPVSGWHEVIGFFTSIAGAALIIVLIIAVVFRLRLVLQGVVLIILVLAFPIIWPLDPGALQEARNEGCIGPPTMVIGLLGLLWLIAIAATFLRRKEVKSC
jgi:hypothetical protein